MVRCSSSEQRSSIATKKAACITGTLRESGFVVAAFHRGSRGALSALAAHPVDLAVIAGQLSGGEDALAAGEANAPLPAGGRQNSSLSAR